MKKKTKHRSTRKKEMRRREEVILLNCRPPARFGSETFPTCKALGQDNRNQAAEFDWEG